jgi:serine/threonine-protein kinase RsbW
MTISNNTSSADPVDSGSAWETLAEFDVPSESGSERAAMERVAAAVADLNLPSARLERLKTAVAEATLNAVEHGNVYDENLPVTVRVLITDDDSRRTLNVRVTDRGTSGPIPSPQTPNLQAKLAGEQSPRGWGFFLIEKMVDALRVSADPAHHTIELFLYLEGEK